MLGTFPSFSRAHKVFLKFEFDHSKIKYCNFMTTSESF